MKKFTLMLAVVCTVAATSTFAQTTPKSKPAAKTTASLSTKKACTGHDACCKKSKEKKAA
jgi:hypothetical protein